MREILLQKTQLKSEIIFSYCPVCVKECKRTGTDYMTLSKLIYVKNFIIYPMKDGGEKKAIDDYYLCPNCKMHCVVDDFLKTYSFNALDYETHQKEKSDGNSMARKSI